VLCITEASLNPGFTSAVIESYKSKFEKIQSCNIYIAPDEGLAANVFQFIGIDGGFRSLTKYKDDYYGQIFEPSMEKMKNTLEIPEINCYYCFHSKILRKLSQILSYFPESNKEWIYEEIVTRTEFLSKQKPNVEIVVKGVSRETGEIGEETWILSENQNLTPFSISSIPACLIVEKILNDQIKSGTVTSCISLFSMSEVEKLMPIFEAYTEEQNVNSISEEFSTTGADRMTDQFIALVYWLETTKQVLGQIKPKETMALS